MKSEVAGAGAGLYFREAGEHCRENPLTGVKAIDDDLIEAQIDGESEAIVGRCADPVGVRAFLALFVRGRSRNAGRSRW